VSRRQFVAVTGGSAAAVAFLAACGSDSSANGDDTSQFGDGDVGILNYALTLEHLEAALYADVVASGLFKGKDLETMHKFGEEEEEHAAELTKLIERKEGDPVEEQKATFSLGDAKSARALISKIENLAAAAYLEQIPNIESAAVMETVLSIHSVEGRHAATSDILAGRPFTPDGEFAKPASVKDVLAAVEPFMAS
jgi:hypothetical protein